MIWLCFSIIASTGIAVIFKFIEKYKIHTFHAIVINYFIASLLGFLLIKIDFNIKEIYSYEWFPLSVAIGIIFIVLFYLIGKSTQKAGITVTIVAVRMAVIIPITFTIIYFNESISFLKIIGIVLALIAVVFSIYREKATKLEKKYFFLPVVIFLGAGLVDSLIKLSQQEYLDDNSLTAFITVLFSISGIIGVFTVLINKSRISDLVKLKVLFWGSLLGFANFGSLYFFVKALTYSPFASSAVFGINHIGIVLFTVLLALIIFKEKLNRINQIGIVVSVIAIYILSRF
ncbi:MAG: DMT family transporter [Bacteroidota bacterium]|nr:DMT family transporter [Bacteroidota bacterium]